MATSGNYKKLVSLQRQRNFVITVILVGIIKSLKSEKYFFFFSSIATSIAESAFLATKENSKRLFRTFRIEKLIVKLTR